MEASFNPQTAVQNDVNGFPRAGAKALLDRGVRYLFSGINSDSGGPPLPRLTAFWWKQPDGRRLFVWLSLSYGDGFFLFEPVEWRRGPCRWPPTRVIVRRAPATSCKPDEASVRAAHQHCVERLQQFERDGYRHPVAARLHDQHVALRQRSAVPAAGGFRRRLEPARPAAASCNWSPSPRR